MKKTGYRGAYAIRKKFLEEIHVLDYKRSNGEITRDYYIKYLKDLQKACIELNMGEVAQEIQGMMGSTL